MKIERLIIYLVFFLRIRRTPRSTRTDTLSLHDALPISVVLALLVFAAWWWLRARRRRAAIVRLFDERLHAANTPVERVAAMSELLRRAARRRDPAADRLQGDAWLAFLDGDRASDVARPFSEGTAIGRASGRERVCQYGLYLGGAGQINKKN